MRAFWLLVASCSLCASAAAALYRHVDNAGNVTYSDRPERPHQEPLRLPPPNVATPEARRQLDLARQASEREQQAEFEMRARRWAAAQRASPAAYSRSLSPYAPRYTLPAYPVSFAPTPTQSISSQGLRSVGGSHHAHHSRR